jgi:hypothetical protein
VVSPHRIVRALVVAGLGLVMWVAARPAWAAAMPYAPLCDDRGATALAPPPTFEPDDEAIRKAVQCNGDPTSFFASIGPARTRPSASVSSVEPVLPVTMTWSVHWGSRPLASAPGATHELCGVRVRVERPPISIAS